MSMHHWQILDTGTENACWNMDKDRQLLHDLRRDDAPLLHLYEWKTPSITYGYFTQPAELLNLEKLSKKGVELARRPTGGGITFHFTDFAFSILIPASHPHCSTNTLNNYAFVNGLILDILTQFTNQKKEFHLHQNPLSHGCTQADHFCLAKPITYDLMLGNKKVGGGAQRRTKQGFLHQGSIILGCFNEDLMLEILPLGSPLIEIMRIHSTGILGRDVPAEALEEERKRLHHLFVTYFTKLGAFYGH